MLELFGLSPFGTVTSVPRVRAQILGEWKAKDVRGLPPKEEPERKGQRGSKGQYVLLCGRTGTAMVNIDLQLDRL